MSRQNSLDRDALGRLSQLPVANISDALDRLSVLPAAIRPMWANSPLVGTAFTVVTAAGDNKVIHEAIDAAEAGDILVINGQGYEDRALIGELMSGRAQDRGIAGFVINGAIRDRAEIEAMRFPVYARAITPAGPYRNGPGHLRQPVAMGGVSVSNGDVVVADGDGVVIIPQAQLAEVIVRAEAKRDKENQQRAMIGGGQVRLA